MALQELLIHELQLDIVADRGAFLLASGHRSFRELSASVGMSFDAEALEELDIAHDGEITTTITRSSPRSSVTGSYSSISKST